MTTALHITLALLATPLAFVLLMYALHWAIDKWGYPGAIRAFKRLGLPEPVEAEAIACFDDARQRQRRTWWYDASAPLVTLIALMFTPRSADRLPAWASRWDNNISLNGDGEWIERDGEQLTLGHDVPWDAVRPGEVVRRYDDPAYTGRAYYAMAHPRSFWARYVWVGLRNRASQLSVDRGRAVPGTPELISGSIHIGTRNAGHFLFRCGDLYHYKSVRKLGPFALIRSYGYKLEIRYYQGPGRAAAVAIGRSLKRWKGPQ